jgi:hypothetical protein
MNLRKPSTPSAYAAKLLRAIERNGCTKKVGLRFIVLGHYQELIGYRLSEVSER